MKPKIFRAVIPKYFKRKICGFSNFSAVKTYRVRVPSGYPFSNTKRRITPPSFSFAFSYLDGLAETTASCTARPPVRRGITANGNTAKTVRCVAVRSRTSRTAATVVIMNHTVTITAKDLSTPTTATARMVARTIIRRSVRTGSRRCGIYSIRTRSRRCGIRSIGTRSCRSVTAARVISSVTIKIAHSISKFLLSYLSRSS